MDELRGSSWSSRPGLSESNSRSPSRHPSPLCAQPSGSQAPSRNASAAQKASAASPNDSFASLLAPKPSRTQTPQTLQDRQKQLLGEKTKSALGANQTHSDPYNAADAQLWESLGSGSDRGTPAPAAEQRNPEPVQDDDDLLATFNAPTPSNKPVPPSNPKQVVAPTSLDNNVEDDDPFGLGQISQRAPPSTQAPRPPPEEDDILGDLGKPVSEATAAARRRESGSRSKGSTPKSISPHDKALAELVDMGFDAKRARQALLKTGDKSDVQAAVGILLTQAHQDSRKESQPGNTTERRNSESARRSRRGSEQGAPPWMRKTPTQETPQSPGERDVSQYASELGNSLFKSANTLWKTGQKRMQKAIAEFQHEGDSSQPRWMREAQLQSPEGAAPPGESSNLGGPRKVTARAEDLTNEAMMLDMNKRSTSGIKQNGHLGKDKLPRRDSDQARPRQPPLGVPVTADTRSRSIPSSASSRQIEKLSRQAVDDQSSQAYISPARRKKAPPKPSEPESSLDIFSTEPAPSQTPVPTSEGVPKKQPASSHRTPTPIQSRPTPPTRSIPSVSPNILSASASHREIGSAAFKRGDYASAHTSYTAALQGIPNSHPMTIVLRCNRALTALKTGDAKVAVTDADAALSSIGPSQGEGETIAVDKGENEKPMRDFFGKALMRKAEALEHTEKWKEAASVWREAVQSGHGGSVAIQGRNRCEKAAAPPQSKNTASATVVKQSVPAKKPLPRAAASMVASLNRPAKESEAVSRLRAANAAASAASDEAFALTDNVEARLGSWKAGKSDNLRALLGSLDTVLWENAGWRKVGMADLVMPNRVKVVYMKAIGKVHPDKIPHDASTEQKMISAGVFATLNEAWDKFKKDNGFG